ncbi:MAG: hypothetical protein JSU59_05495, partial [Nitrospirota bacterium]
PGEINFVVMRRAIGTVVVTEFAVITFLFHLFEILGRELGDITVIVINAVKERIEGRTEIKTPAAAIADVIDSQRFIHQLVFVPAGSDQIKNFHIQ